MALSTENRNVIRAFFDDKSLYDTFIDLFNYQCTICDGIEFVDRGSIIGFGKQGEHLRCYVTKSASGFLLKIKTIDEAQIFSKADFDEFKLQIQYNTLMFSLEKDKYKITTPPKTQTKKKSKTSRQSKEKKDPVLAKLKNRNRARKYTLDDFNELADWSYCASFNEDGYIYTLPNGNQIECDSKSETKLLDYLTENKIAIAIGGQELLIKYSSAFRSDLDFYPDIVILTKDYHIAIIECKPVTAMSYHKNIEKYDALRDYCDENGYEYMMVDPDHDYTTYDEMLKMHIPKAIVDRVEAYLVDYLGKRRSCILDKDDIQILYEDFSDEYKKGEFSILMHALIIQKGWYNRYKNGFMVFENPKQ